VPSDPDSGADSGGFGLDLDELLSEAVDAVESIEKKAVKRPRGPGVDDEELLLSGDDVPTGEELDIDLDDTLTSLTDTLADDTELGDDGPDAAAGLEDDLVIVELEAELSRIRKAHDDQLGLTQQARVELSRVRGSLRRHEEQLAREGAKLERERQMRRGAEEQLSTMKRRLDQLEANLAGLRRRAQRERDEARTVGTTRAVETLLPVLDNLELAISHKQADPARVVEGIGMIVQQFLQTLAQLGVERVVCAPGVLFDPEVHEALSQIETHDMLPGSIVEQLRPGYLFDGRLLRAARVSVAATPPSAIASDRVADSIDDVPPPGGDAAPMLVEPPAPADIPADADKPADVDDAPPEPPAAPAASDASPHDEPAPPDTDDSGPADPA